MIKISIITPVYNGGRFIEACIKNVIGQNCPLAEHVIVDGGSTDGTVEIIREYEGQYPHIIWISEKDRGQSDAMNKGIEIAKGGIISFLNADDFYEPNVLNRILNIFKTLPEPALLVGNCNIWQEDGTLECVNKPSKLRLKDILSYHPHPANPSAYFYHKSLHQNIGPYKVNEHYALDLDFILRAVQSAEVKYVDETWGNWRLIKGSKTCSDRNMVERKIHILKRYQKNFTFTGRLMVTVLRCIHMRVVFLKQLTRRLYRGLFKLFLAR